MATRLKTIHYSFPTYTSVIADATVTNLTQITVYLPEASPTFISVTADLAFMDVITATGGTIASHRCAIQLAAAGYSTVTQANAIAHTGEKLSGVVGPFDFTSYFATNWSGSSMTCDAQVFFDQSTGTTLGMNNVNVVLTITYSYDDDPAVNPTQIKTVRIPLESLAGSLSTTVNSNIGSNQIPQLTGVGGFLPEDSIVIRDYSFLIEGNSQTNGSGTDYTVTADIDAASAFSFGVFECALASDTYFRLTYTPTPPSSGASHNLQVWSSVAAKANHLCMTLVITYEFDASTTTRVLNSLLLPIELSSPIGVTTTSEASRFYREFFIEEPGTIVLNQSAYRLNFSKTAAVSGLATRSGGQSYRAYTNLGSVECGMHSLQQRIDSGSAQGSGISINRGLNSIAIDVYATDITDQMTNVSGYFILNYTSDKSPQGVGQHNHTVFIKTLNWNSQLLDRIRISNFSIDIPETHYWLTSIGFVMIQWLASASSAVTFDVECLSGEGAGAGYYDIYTDAYQSDAERACTITYMRGRDIFKRNPGDSDLTRLDLETARDYRIFNSTAASVGLLAILTYHSFTFTAADSISGGFSGLVTLNLHRADTGEKVATTSRVGDGPYSFVWYDNTVEMYVECIDSIGQVGRSQNTLCS